MWRKSEEKGALNSRAAQIVESEPGVPASGGTDRQRGTERDLSFDQSLLAEDKDEEPQRTLEEGSVRGSASQGLLFCLFSAFRNVTVV